jgi:hypothetical protein
MITKALHPEISGNPRTNLTTKANSAQANLVVQNAVDFSANDMVVIGIPGQELTEIRKIASISGKTLTLSAVLTNTHPQNTKITFIKYDQIKFYKSSTIDGTYNIATTKNISIDEPHTLYDDSTALSTDYFKIRYFNSYTSDLSVLSDPISSAGFPRYALKSIQDAMFKKFGDRKEQFLDRDEMTDWANELKDDMVNRIVDSNEKYFNTFENLSIDANGESPLNDRFRKFQKVFVLFDGVNGKRAKKMELEEINDFTQVFNENFPGYYFKEYNVGVRPKGTVGTTLVQVHFEKQPADMQNDMDELDKPMRFYMHVFMDGMMAKGCEKSGKDNRALIYWKKYENGCQNMIEEINNLVLDENRGVRDEEEDAI